MKYQSISYLVCIPGVFNEGKYWDVFAEYAKNTPNDVLCRITAVNRGPETATIHVLPQLWFRNTWIWGCSHEGCTIKPKLRSQKDGKVYLHHDSLGKGSIIKLRILGNVLCPYKKVEFLFRLAFVYEWQYHIILLSIVCWVKKYRFFCIGKDTRIRGKPKIRDMQETVIRC